MLAFVDEKNIQIHTKVSCKHCASEVSLPTHDIPFQAYPFSKVNEMIEEALKGETDGRLVLTF